MKKSTLLYVVLALVLLGGCATQEGVRPKWTLQAKDFAPITPGNTNKADVERMVGKPIMTMVFRNLGEETWDYRYLDGTITYAAEVHFDMQGKTKYYVTYPDNCVFAPVGCR
jgi:outer membrane protein assembly factor BamE (lipoprotein component of BamABCDE complex)